MDHDHITASHPGELETFNSISHHYWWPGLRTFVKNYVKGCGICQQFKIDRHPSKPAFLPTEGAKTTRPFAYSMDFITDLPSIRNFDSILVVVDQGLSKGGDSPPLQQNDHRGKNGKTFTRQPIQTVRTTRQNNLRSRPTIRIKIICWTTETPRNKISTVNGISSTDWQNHGTSQPGNWIPSINLLHIPPRRVAQRTKHPGIYAQ